MSTKPCDQTDAPMTSRACANIAQSTERLLPSSPAEFRAVFEEHRQEHKGRVRAVDIAMEDVRLQVLGAACRLMGVDEAERVFFSSYQGVSDGDAGNTD